MTIILAFVVVACESERAPATAVSATTTVLTSSGGEREPVRVMPLGDSITQGDSDHDTYRRALWKSLTSDGFDVDFVGSLRAHHRGEAPSNDFDHDHEGHWGWRTDEVLERIEAWTEAAAPHVVLVHLGSNDVFQGQSIDSTAEELDRLIDAIRAVRPEVTILLAQIIPTTTAAVNVRIRELNERIPALVASKSTATSPLLVVDHHSGFDPARQTYDGVHPNVDGEIHMSDRWLDALEEVLTR